MPRLRSDGRVPSWDRLYELSAPQNGYFSTGQAQKAGYSAQLLQYYLRRGKVEKAGRGVFRLVHFPPGEHEDLIVAWLWSGMRGTFSHDTALALHELSDVLPTRIHMTVPDAWRRRRLRVPRGVVLHYGDLPKTDITWSGAVPITRPLRTVADSVRANVPQELTRQAITQGLRRGSFSKEQVRAALGGRIRHSRHPGAEERP